MPTWLISLLIGLAGSVLAWSFGRNIRSLDKRQDDCESRDEKQSAEIAELKSRCESQGHEIATLKSETQALKAEVAEHRKLLFQPITAKSG